MRLFEPTGAHVLVDGQYGSTGKGALAAWLAAQPGQPDWGGVVSNAGPNSGHTFYHEGRKVVLKQLPTFAVAHYLRGNVIPVYLSAGAVIDVGQLVKEANDYPNLPIFVHPNAAVITADDRAAEHSGTMAAVAGTRSGTGSAIARKVMRDPRAVMDEQMWTHLPYNIHRMGVPLNPRTVPYFVEVSQGFSLGINSQFYPKVTSRECTVMQAIADARIPPRLVTKTYMSIRTFPIRVGSVDGFDSGGWYPDQREVTWGSLGVKPELTTVTQRVRRVATFSRQQFIEAVHTNDPDFVFVNFLNYLKEHEQISLLREIDHLGAVHEFNIIRGYGPETKDIESHEQTDYKSPLRGRAIRK